MAEQTVLRPEVGAVPGAVIFDSNGIEAAVARPAIGFVRGAMEAGQGIGQATPCRALQGAVISEDGHHENINSTAKPLGQARLSL
ncbi:hypothetical protein SAMN06295912_102302 [Sphingomonas laterariae]|uniref:Uncharacterized protein n=1 Tax=Edaphosphingomonas laterariae TaxID=861865 RepID=A0A239CMR0_9SPHN|nr:hypothetical protein [Sphingomonas laterariae]SNS21455.1 hypothetical protein SAMN06295912_102302 [Sphingomonas laterariae]